MLCTGGSRFDRTPINFPWILRFSKQHKVTSEAKVPVRQPSVKGERIGREWVFFSPQNAREGQKNEWGFGGLSVVFFGGEELFQVQSHASNTILQFALKEAIPYLLWMWGADAWPSLWSSQRATGQFGYNLKEPVHRWSVRLDKMTKCIAREQNGKRKAWTAWAQSWHV